MLKKIFLSAVVVVRYVPARTHTSSPGTEALIAACKEIPGKAWAQLLPFIEPAPDGVTYRIALFDGNEIKQQTINIQFMVFIRGDFGLRKKQLLNSNNCREGG